MQLKRCFLVNANMKYLATYKGKIEIFTGKGKHLCTFYTASNASITAVRELRPLRYILYSFSLLLLYMTLEELKMTKNRIGVRYLRMTAV